METSQLLYILTDDTLYRISSTNLNSETLGSGDNTVVIVATLAGLNLPSHATFSDFVSSDTLGLLATSNGLYRTSNGNDISTDPTNDAITGWTKVSLSEGYEGVTKLLPISSTDKSYEFASNGPGQVYALSSSVGLKSAAIHRFAILDVKAAAAITNNSIQLITNPYLRDADLTVFDVPFSYLGVYRNNFATNGATLLAGSSQYLTVEQQLEILPNALKIGVPFNYKSEKKVDAGLSDSLSELYGIERNSATGSWLMYGNFGLRTLE